MPTHRAFCGVLAAAASGVCVGMAAAAAADRAVTAADQWIMTAVAIAVAIGSHLLPALARNAISKIVFIGCIVVTMYHHAHYFHAVQVRAGNERAKSVTATTKSQALKTELDASAATRALPIVTKELSLAVAKAAQAQLALARCKADNDKCGASEAAVTATQARVQALTDERDAANRVAALRKAMLDEATAHDAKMTVQAIDPIDAQLAQWMGISAEGVGLGLSLLQSLLLELMAVILWQLALPSSKTIAFTAIKQSDEAKKHHQNIPQLPAKQPSKMMAAIASKQSARWQNFIKVLAEKTRQWKHLWPWPAEINPSKKGAVIAVK